MQILLPILQKKAFKRICGCLLPRGRSSNLDLVLPVPKVRAPALPLLVWSGEHMPSPKKPPYSLQPAVHPEERVEYELVA